MKNKFFLFYCVQSMCTIEHTRTVRDVFENVYGRYHYMED